MSVDFKTDFSLKRNINTLPKPANNPEPSQDKPESQITVKSSTPRDFTLGAVTAATALITLGVLARKGKFGKNLQRYLGGAEREVKEIKPHTHAVPEPKTNTMPENKSTAASGTSKPQPQTEKTSELQQTEQIQKPQKPIQTYSTKLPETVKEYKSEDIQVSGYIAQKPFQTNGSSRPSIDTLKKVHNKDLTVLYDDANETTEIILPCGSDFFGVKINGIVSKERVKDIFRTLNANGIADPDKFTPVITGVLNGKYNTQYSIKNIGIYFDFHDRGAYQFRGGGEKWCTDGRILLRKMLRGKKWEGYAISYNTPKDGRSTTEIAVALPWNSGERPLSNHYAIFLDGLIPPGTCHRLVKYLETVVQNPKDIQYEELAKIQEETLKFLNVN